MRKSLSRPHPIGAGSLSGSTAMVLSAAIVAATPLVSALPAAAQTTDSIALEALAPETLAAGEVIVHFRPGTSEATRDQVLALVGGVFVGSIGMADVVLAKVPAGTEVAAAESLAVDPNVLAAEPSGVTQATAPE
jgi:hypothetical protein